MSIQAGSATAHARRVMAALAFWLSAVLFVIDVSLLSGWLSTEAAAAAPTAPTPAATPTEPATPASTPAASDVALDGGATITFPHPPTQTQEIVDVGGDETVLVIHTATAHDETTYNAGVIEYPPGVDVSDPAVNLIGSVSGAAGSSNARISSQEVTPYQGAPAVEFTLDAAGSTVLARNVLVGHRLYAISVTFSTAGEPPDAQDFLDSLELPD